MRYHYHIPLMLLVVPVLSTFLGGWLALRFRTHLTLVIGFGCGLLLGAALEDLLPQALELGAGAGIGKGMVLGWTGGAWLLFAALGAGMGWIEHRWHRPGGEVFHRAAALMLVFHSFRDGVAIGAAFSASHAAGYAVACGIGAHDLGDGMNTVRLTTRGAKATSVDYAFLAADALAPLAGGLSTAWWMLSAHESVWVLVTAAGFFLAVAVADLLPELRRASSARGWGLAALLGSALAGVLVISGANLLLARLQGG